MILDLQNQFMNKSTAIVHANGAAFVLGNVIDLWGGLTIPPAGTGSNAQPNAINGPVGGSLTHDPGKGESIEIVMQVTTALTSAGGTATLVISLLNDTVDTLNSAPVTLGASPSYTIDAAGANLKAGDTFRFMVELPPGTTKRYLGLTALIGTEAITAGALTAGFTPVRQTTNDMTFV